MLRWLVLDLNSFFASCEQQEAPELRGRPLIVVQTMAETTCAIAASYPAKALGIKTGTLVHEARRLCPDLKLVQANHKLYVEYHHRILRAIDEHIPVEEVMSIDEVACRLDKVQQHAALAQKLAREIKNEIHFCRRLAVEVKWLGRDRELWTTSRSFAETQDTAFLLHILQEIWNEVPELKPLRIGVALSGLAPEQAHQPGLFDKPRDARLVTAIDELNARFGKGAITFGAASTNQTSKIAFQRVPRVKEL